jgi:hypothetical protein
MRIRIALSVMAIAGGLIAAAPQSATAGPVGPIAAKPDLHNGVVQDVGHRWRRRHAYYGRPYYRPYYDSYYYRPYYRPYYYGGYGYPYYGPAYYGAYRPFYGPGFYGRFYGPRFGVAIGF